MPFTVTMPKLSPTMEEGTVAKWHKKVGDFIESGEVFIEIATDKATVEHTALDEGYLRKILIQEGGGAKVNEPIAIFTEKADESIEGYQPEGEIKPPAEAKKEEAAPKKKKEEAPPPIGQPAFVPEPPLEGYQFRGPEPSTRVKASPLAKKLAKEKGLDVSTVRGSGPGGRVTSRDLPLAQPAGLVTFGRSELPKEAPGSFEEIPLTPMRKVIAKRLQESKSFVPHFYVKQVVDASSLVRLREELKQLELKVTFNDMVIRAAALALRKHPEVNGGFNSVNNTLIRFKTIDISVAVTVDDGLITPIIRHADFKNLGEISAEVKVLAEKARKGKLSESEYKGGSFCVSNLGMFGITEFSAVINPPQAAILAVGGIEEAPVIRGGTLAVGHHLPLVLSADHRVIDGALAAQFIKTLQFLLENPISLAM